jgi:pyruvate dehydrogenase E2 component (dihydrolipoamide acetyltransferase)
MWPQRPTTPPRPPPRESVPTAVADRIVISRAPASPAVRKLARELAVDLDSIEASGPNGRVTRADVERAAALKESTSARSAVSIKSAAAARLDRANPPAASRLPGERAGITQARKTIAKVMAESWATIPHVTDTDDADVTDLERLRRQHVEAAAPGAPKLTMLAFMIRAVTRALRQFPKFNASFDADRSEVVHHEAINIAVGVHTERGLIAPVIRDAERLGILDIAAALAEIAEKARSATFAVHETRGGTYTISNPGAMGGSRYSTPIITPPQVAVLAAGRMKWVPWVVGAAAPDGSRGAQWGEGMHIEPRLILPLSHSFDHRIIDGGDEVPFLRHIVADLENPGRLVL